MMHDYLMAWYGCALREWPTCLYILKAWKQFLLNLNLMMLTALNIILSSYLGITEGARVLSQRPRFQF